jgi:thiol-disulfide isomerase/thioredoxin
MEAMEPNPAFDPESYPDAIAAFDALGQDARVLVWGGDWCPDTRQELPDFAALLEATQLRADQIEIYEVDHDKQGPKVEEYDVTHIPTIVIERGGEEIARFVEGETMPAPVYLGDRLGEAGLPD